MSWFVDKLGPPPGRPASPGQGANSGRANGAQAKAAPPPKNAAPPPKAAAKAAPPPPADDKKKKKGWF